MASTMPLPVVVSTAGNDLAFKLIGGLAASCFIGALLTDIVYASHPDMVWVTFSVWAVTIGLILAGVATIVGLVARIAHGRLGLAMPYWPYLVGFGIVVVVEFFNAFVHSRDAYQAVVPEGITLSALAVLILILTPVAARANARAQVRSSSQSPLRKTPY